MGGPADPVLDDAGFAPSASVVVRHEQAVRVAACIDADPHVLDAGLLPSLWHWAIFVPNVRTSDLGDDGHPRRRAEMASFPQRMWVGGRIHTAEPLQLGERAERRSELMSASMKDGSGGRFWLLTVKHVVSQGATICIEEEQDIVLRAAGALAPPGAERDDAPTDEWVEEHRADPVLLFRFSAVTGNAHRIHYDHPYATRIEGYPDLVVHSPLTAVLLADLARRQLGEDPRHISFRARSPHFANRRFWLTGHPTDDGASLAALRDDHAIAMTLDVR